MRLRVLFINPWIYDFAATNLWSRPLGLLKVMEYMSRFDVDPVLIDCMDTFQPKRFGRGKYPKSPVEKPRCLSSIPRRYSRYGMDADDFRRGFRTNGPYDAIFITSVMSYWYQGVQTAVEIVRSESKTTPVVLGGIYATLWHRHAADNSGADFIFRGPVEKGIDIALKTFGFRLKKIRELVPWYRMGLYESPEFHPLLTSSGCPFQCSYCGSHLLSDGFSQRDPTDVVREIEEISRIGIEDVAFYDDALFYNNDNHLKVILKALLDIQIRPRFHCPNGLHARFVDDELAMLMHNAGFRTVRLSFETVNPHRLAQTGDKVAHDDLKRAVSHLKRNGFRKRDIGVYLMYALPGQGLDEVSEGVSFIKDLGVRINLTEFSPIPDTGCWNDLLETGVISDDIDPLLTNNSVFSLLYSGYDWNELEKLKKEVKDYNSQPP